MLTLLEEPQIKQLKQVATIVIVLVLQEAEQTTSNNAQLGMWLHNRKYSIYSCNLSFPTYQLFTAKNGGREGILSISWLPLCSEVNLNL